MTKPGADSLRDQPSPAKPEESAAAPLPTGADAKKLGSPAVPTDSPPVQTTPPCVLPVGSVPTAVELAARLSECDTETTIAESPGWRSWLNLPNLASMILHAWALLALALWTASEPPYRLSPTLTASLETDTGEPEALTSESLPIEQPESAFEVQGAPLAAEESLDTILATGAQQPREPATAAQRPLSASVLLQPLGEAGGGLQGRNEEARARLVHARGGNAASERAVSRGLRWLMAHQLNDGGWRFNLELCPDCRGACRNSGNVGSTTAATALALLPFLGAGSTHQQGEYHEVVNRGLYYLSSRMQLDQRGGDLQEGTMYAQGLATLALCEAYALTQDEILKDYAQEAVKFIEKAQHKAGGWRYIPGQPGDTTSLGWQLMALKSARRASLNVSPAAFYGAARFLDSVATDAGAGYGYQTPARTDTMSAIGLLSRMYLGWQRNHPALERGVERLAAVGPSPHSMYLNYYATQTLFHYEGPLWEQWNATMRDYLISQQATAGHEAGSWWFEDNHTASAGRLYDTAMAIMILEVYYRYLPLYGHEMVAGEGIVFPVD